jgi:polyhydroxybutyrate depolymerase
VKFEWQQPVIDAVKTLDQCGGGTPWIAPMCTIYPSASGCPMVTYLHNGKHMVPPDAPDLIVKFFKSLPSGTPK